MAATVKVRPLVAPVRGNPTESAVLCVLCDDVIRDGGPRVEHGVCRHCHPIALEGVLNRLLDPDEV